MADGLEPTDDVETADVVVLNTCCIRENADNKLYGHLGWLKSLQESRPGMQIAVGGCLAQKDRERSGSGRRHVDVVFGTHNLGRAPALLRRARGAGPVVEVLDGRPTGRTRPDASPPSPPSGTCPMRPGSPSRSGCDNSCAFCIVPQVRGPEVTRPFDTWWTK